MAILDDIAAQTGLARSSVAGVLRGQKGFNPDTRERVLSVARKLNYRPSYLGKALAGAPTRTIGLVTHITRNLSALERRDGLEDAARAADYCTFTISLHASESPDAIVRGLQGLLDRRIDGLVVQLNAEQLDLPAVADLLAASSIPLVFIGNAPRGKAAHVHIRRHDAYRQLVDHLHAFGHRRLVLARTYGRRDLYQYSRLIDLPALRGRGVELLTDAQWVMPFTSDYPAAAYELVRRRLAHGAVPTAIAMTNDQTAVAAVAAIQDTGLAVPHDISVIGFDDDPTSRFTRPPLTTIRQPGSEAGKVAFERLSQLIQQPDQPLEPRTMPCELVVRASTGPAPSHRS